MDLVTTDQHRQMAAAVRPLTSRPELVRFGPARTCAARQLATRVTGASVFGVARPGK